MHHTLGTKTLRTRFGPSGQRLEFVKPYCYALLLLSALASCSTSSINTTNSATNSATSPATTSSLERLGAVGIGVSNLAKSSEFYQQVLGLELLRSYELGYLDELVLGYTEADRTNTAVVVLMNWPGDTDRQYGSGEMKLVFYVDDPKGVIERIRQRGGAIDREATPHPALNGGLVGLARDPDNYIIEVLQR